MDRRKNKFLSALVCLALASLASVVGARSEWFSWESRTELSYDQLIALAGEMGTRGYAPTRIDSSFENGEIKFATIWIKEDSLSNVRWQFGIRMNAEMLQSHVEEIKSKGLAPIDVAVTTVKGEPVFSMISGSGTLRNWESRHGLTEGEVKERTQANARIGLDLIDVNAYPTPDGMRFAAVWGDAGFEAQINALAVTETEFERELRRLPAGFIPFNVNVGSIADEIVYSAIFVKDPKQIFRMRYDISGEELRAFFAEQVNAGYAPFTLNSYNRRLQTKFAAVFAKKRPTNTKSNPIFTPQPSQSLIRTGRTLSIAPVLQQTKVWCWLAIGEMVFRHFGLQNNNPSGNYQCGIIGTIMSDTECFTNCLNVRCIRPSGSNYATVRMLKDYAWISSKRVVDATEGYELPFSAVKANIDAGRPIIAGVSPNRRQYYDGAEHVALIVGYETGPMGVDLIINDPFPYPPMGNPYTRNGAAALGPYRYRMSMRDFTRSLYWHWSISNISIK